MSKMLDVGPRNTMKRKMDLARQVIGTLRYSGSTLSLSDHCQYFRQVREMLVEIHHGMEA
jgi:hypothetical protein